MEEERARSARASSGANALPLRSQDVIPVRSAKRLTSPERWEIKQLISSGAIDASEYPDLDEDVHNPTAHAEVEEELDVEIREEEPPFLAGQTKRTLDLSPVKIVKAPDGSLNRSALAGASLAKERRELRQQEANEQVDSEARDFSQPWLDPMSKESDKMFAQDLRGNLKGQKAGEVPKWREQSFNKATTFGEITTLSIQEQRKSLPIYKLRDPLLKAIGEASSYNSFFFDERLTPYFSIKSLSLLAILGLVKQPRWCSTLPKPDIQKEVALVVRSPVVLLQCQ
jgi:ATP-dependent RNA helicase DHX8/PRP22